MAKGWNFSATQWIAWLGATAVACVGLTSFAYQTFQTKEEARDDKADVVQRLMRMEDKLDRIIERK